MPCLCALVNPEAEKDIVRLRIIGTGNRIKHNDFNPSDFLGTFQLKNGFVGHVFRVA